MRSISFLSPIANHNTAPYAHGFNLDCGSKLLGSVIATCLAAKGRAIWLFNISTPYKTPAVSRLGGCVVLTGIWAMAYALNLGAPELRSEEGHRVMPAVQMLESENYLVPYVGTEPYLRKPPLVNWSVAASFKLFGARNEWAARFPSAFFILTVAITLATLGSVVLGRFGAMMAALCWLTNLGLMEKGRMIEIEAIYVSLFAFAFIVWLVAFERNWSPWITFTVPWIFLGLGLLAKGPLHIIFFYALVCAVLWSRQRLRDLRHPAHLIGILLMLGIFLVWAVPCFRALYTHAPHRVWLHEIGLVFHGEKSRSENWALNFPRGFAYFLPWVLVVPFIRLSKIPNPMQCETVRGLAWGMILPFVVVLLIPGTLPRYVLPLVAPFCWMLGIVCAAGAFEWGLSFRKLRVAIPGWVIPFCVAVGVVAAVVIFPLRSVTYYKKHERLRPIAAKVNAHVAAHERLYAVDVPFQPYLFYVHAPVTYVKSLKELPADARYFLIPPKHEKKIRRSLHWSSSQPVVWTPQYPPKHRGGETILFAAETP